MVGHVSLAVFLGVANDTLLLLMVNGQCWLRKCPLDSLLGNPDMKVGHVLNRRGFGGGNIEDLRLQNK